MDHRYLEHRQKVYRELLEPSRNSAALFEPADALLDDAPPAIRLFVELQGSTVMIRPLILSLRDHCADPVITSPLANARIAVPLIPSQALRAHSRATQWLRDLNLVHRRFEAGGVVDLTSGYLCRDRKALAVSNQVEFAAESASRAAQSVVRGFVVVSFGAFFWAPAAARDARTFVPSMQNRSQSIFPSRSSRIWSAVRIRSYVPSERHLLKWWYTVCQGPNRSGRSRHGAPVRRIQRTPLNSSLASRRGRPFADGSLISRGSRSFHWSSVTS